MKLPDKLAQRRDLIAQKLGRAPNLSPYAQGVAEESYLAGFNAAWEELAPVVEMLDLLVDRNKIGFVSEGLIDECIKSLQKIGVTDDVQHT